MAWRDRQLGQRVFRILEFDLGAHVHRDQCVEIVSAIWGFQPGDPERFHDFDFDPFFEIFKDKCENLNPMNHVVQTYGDVVDLINQVKVKRDYKRREILSSVRGNFGNGAGNAVDSRILNSIELAMQIFLMLFVGNSHLNLRPGVRVCPLQWGNEQTINELLIEAFPPFNDTEAGNAVTINLGTGNAGAVHVDRNSGTINVGTVGVNTTNAGASHARTGNLRASNARPAGSTPSRRFSDFFNLRDMEHLAGFEIYPTHNLLDHLLIIKYPERKFKSRVYIFYHASILKELMLGDVQLGPGLAQETLQTLGLLIPDFADCQRWFNRQHSRLPTDIDIQAGRQSARAVCRRVSDFNFWRQRLLLLEKEFDMSERATFQSYLIDRRNPRQWAIGMVTIFGVVLAIIALLATIIATVYGGKSVQEAKIANAMASNASTFAIAAMANSSSTGNTSSPFATMVCCCPTNNSTLVINSLGTHATTNDTRVALSGTSFDSIVTITVFSLETTTISITKALTSTVSLALPITSSVV
ncbi:hypothetical protein BGZ60DRAFT_516507 [Tricladium varicosporioides]|nr:hypothetical protein BGZ60DRAFT_516507 [Hymenoscyphus varicosporioides]